ncbi:MAG: hypothetical protein MHMPM18_004152 [Marteilia pararefringens]
MLHLLLLLILPSTFCQNASYYQQDEQCIKKIKSNLSATNRSIFENAMLFAQLVSNDTTEGIIAEGIVQYLRCFGAETLYVE